MLNGSKEAQSTGDLRSLLSVHASIHLCISDPLPHKKKEDEV